MIKKPPQPDFLKLKLSNQTLLGFMSRGNPTRQEIETAASLPTALRYIFKRYYQGAFVPTLMGDSLLVMPHHLDLHLKPSDVEVLAGIVLKHGFRLGEFHDEWRKISGLRHEFNRANYYAPREELLGIKGDIIDMEPEAPVQQHLPQGIPLKLGA